MKEFYAKLKSKYNDLLSIIPSNYKSDQLELITTLFAEFFRDLDYAINSYQQNGPVGGSFNQPNNIINKVNVNRNFLAPLPRVRPSDYEDRPTVKYVPSKQYDIFGNANVLYEFPPNSLKTMLV